MARRGTTTAGQARRAAGLVRGADAVRLAREARHVLGGDDTGGRAAALLAARWRA